MKKTTQTLCLFGMGIALFVTLTLCLQVPVFENYYLCLGYVVMAVFCYSFGPAAGMVTGCLGVVLYCVLTSGLRGMPGWALGNLPIGLVLGLMFRTTKKWKSLPAKVFVWVAGILCVTAVGILGVKSLTEHLLYTQPVWARVLKNLYAFIADAFVLIVSLPVCIWVDKAVEKTGK